MTTTNDSVCVGHEACPECGSGDNVAVYDDGHKHCFSVDCEYHVAGDGTATVTTPKRKLKGKPLIKVEEYPANPSRRLSETTCEKWKYGIGKDAAGNPVRVASYRDASGREVAQKIRGAGKKFFSTGEIDEAQLFGQHLWGGGGKKVVVTEGEIDAMSVSQLQNHKWPVVSIPTGAQGAVKALSRQVEWLESFDEVILMFDNDEAGQKAAVKCAGVFSPGKCKIASLPLKDANEMLVENRGSELITAIWQAKEYRPDGIVTLEELKDDVLTPTELGLPWPWPTLTKLTYGRRRGELYCLGAGTGVGKTDVFTQIIAQTITELNLPVGVIYLEQPPTETLKRIAGKIGQKRFHVPDDSWTPEQLADTVKVMEDAGKLYLYDHFGAMEWDTIKSRVRFMAKSMGVKDIFIDHLTALAATEDDERKALEGIMSELSGMCQELGVTIYLISHLATPEGKPHEEGGRVMIRHFKGSRAIGFWSHYMFGLERDQQADNEEERITTTFRVLKDRYTGSATGEVFYLGYDRETGLLNERDKPNGDDGTEQFINEEEGY